MLKVEAIDLFYGASQALRRVSVGATVGRVTCVLGRNGVGKSSLMRAIVGLQPVRNGRIAVDGTDVTALPAYERARLGVAYVPQGREIFARLTVRENLETGFAPLPRAKRVLPDEVFALFPVLKDMLGRRGGDLSGGQQQQLAIARALVTRPRLLVLDEPTEGIQPSIIKDLGKVLRDIRSIRNICIVVCEQVLSFVLDVADRILVMEGGRIVHADTRDHVDEATIARFLAV